MYLLSQFCLNSFFLTYSKPRSRRDELCVARLPVLPRDEEEAKSNHRRPPLSCAEFSLVQGPEVARGLPRADAHGKAGGAAGPGVRGAGRGGQRK